MQIIMIFLFAVMVTPFGGVHTLRGSLCGRASPSSRLCARLCFVLMLYFGACLSVWFIVRPRVTFTTAVRKAVFCFNALFWSLFERVVHCASTRHFHDGCFVSMLYLLCFNAFICVV
jgi:hypothetical protein